MGTVAELPLMVSQLGVTAVAEAVSDQLVDVACSVLRDALRDAEKVRAAHRPGLRVVGGGQQ